MTLCNAYLFEYSFIELALWLGCRVIDRQWIQNQAQCSLSFCNCYIRNLSENTVNSIMKIDNDFTNTMNINSQISNQNANNNETTVRKDANGKAVVGVMLPDYLKENLDIVVVN